VNAVSDITIGASNPNPFDRARTPNETPNAPTATHSGTETRNP
jgi:hypothetical protein